MGVPHSICENHADTKACDTKRQQKRGRGPSCFCVTLRSESSGNTSDLFYVTLCAFQKYNGIGLFLRTLYHCVLWTCTTRALSEVFLYANITEETPRHLRKSSKKIQIRWNMDPLRLWS
ncbi:hypothetical protein KP509_16G071900 [Ceratopteris richardii]|uniref:Uncharacterized protein n=1 Tax=Ceratopteris richardii TaxID=49495 RepID=A0A8T2T5J0_CERRI|nr:hypothetical protein KP509_16G071900 [Ceratopteris richardii]